MKDYSKYRIPTACGYPACGNLKHNHKLIDCGIPSLRPACGINILNKKAA